MTTTFTEDQLASRVVFAANFAPAILTGWVCAPADMPRDEVQRLLVEDGAQDSRGMMALPPEDWAVISQEDPDPGLVSPGQCSHSDKRVHWKITYRKMADLLKMAGALDEGIEYE